MALYRMRCVSCGFDQDRRMAAALEPRALCSLCGEEARPVPPARGQEIVRSGDDWVGKGMELRAQMARRAARINFTVLSTGVVICITEEEKVEIFSNQHNAAGMKLITDPAIKSNMRLCHSGTHVRFAHGEKIYSFAVRKTP
jgi:hypothetical protein